MTDCARIGGCLIRDGSCCYCGIQPPLTWIELVDERPLLTADQKALYAVLLVLLALFIGLVIAS